MIMGTARQKLIAYRDKLVVELDTTGQQMQDMRLKMVRGVNATTAHRWQYSLAALQQRMVDTQKSVLTQINQQLQGLREDVGHHMKTFTEFITEGNELDWLDDLFHLPPDHPKHKAASKAEREKDIARIKKDITMLRGKLDKFGTPGEPRKLANQKIQKEIDRLTKEMQQLSESAKGVTYHTCPECEANFPSTQLKNGKFPPHREFNGTGQCEGVGMLAEGNVIQFPNGRVDQTVSAPRQPFRHLYRNQNHQSYPVLANKLKMRCLVAMTGMPRLPYFVIY